MKRSCSMLNIIRKNYYKLIGVEKKPNFAGYGVTQYGKLIPVYRSEIRHETLEPEQIQRIVKLKAILEEAYPLSIEEWIDGFRRDTDPEQEIQIIEALAWVYVQLTNGIDLSPELKKQIYSTLCYLSTCRTLPKDIDRSIPKYDGSLGASELHQMCIMAIEERKVV